jgi:hypothetical protein
MEDRFLGHRAFLSGRRALMGPMIAQSVPLDDVRDPNFYEGSLAYGRDRQLYYSDGVEWSVPVEDVVIARPSALIPTTALEQLQLRLTEFYSPAGLQQVGAYFEVAASEDGFDTPLFTKTIFSETVSSYTTLYPEDGLVPGQEFWWRALYYGTEGQQSAFSIPFKQTYPDFITNPVPVTREGITSGLVEVSPFESAFGFLYVETQVEFFDPADPDTVVRALTDISGASVTIPTDLAERQEYLWRARYGGRENQAGSVTYTDWTEKRSVFNGAASIVLVYDPNRALNRTITLGLGSEDSSATVNVTVDWGDGTTETFTSRGNRTHTYDAGFVSNATVTISGQLTQFGGNYDQTGLIRVNSIGFKLGLTSLRRAFSGVTTNLTVFSVSLPAEVIDLSYLFYNSEISTQIYNGIAALNTENIQTLNSVFRDSTFNGNLSAWDVSKVTDFGLAFYYHSRYSGLTQFSNDSIVGWDVSSGQDFNNMFAGDHGSGRTYQNTFNEDLSGWNVSAARNMSRMFRYGEFNQDISAWNVSSVTDFSRMFERTTAFARSLVDWDVGSGTNFYAMFAHSSYPGDCTGWDVSNATDMGYMFSATGAVVDVTDWDTSSVTVMNHMFHGCASVVGEGGFDTGNVTNMAYMFYSTPIVPDVQFWDVSRVTNFSDTFRGISTVPDLSGWDVRSAQNFSRMFWGTNIAALDISGWNVSSATTFQDMFGSSSQYSAGADGWDLPNVIGTIRPNWSSLTDQSYSETLIGWANHIVEDDGPYNVFFDNGANALEYDASVRDAGGRFPTAVDARNFLIAPKSARIIGASDANASGYYLFNPMSGLYEKSDGWYIGKEGDDWVLRDAANTAQANGGGNQTEPYLVATWDGVLASATIERAGAGWTITGDSQV